jgi:hypothetical protein
MTATLALSGSIVCILWLLHRDAKERTSVSSATWIVVAWAALYGSRPVTTWFTGVDQGPLLPESYDAGNAIEGMVHLLLIVGGLLVLARRGVQVPAVIKNNPYLCLFYLFWVMSVLWSDYPVITAKRLVKDLGNVILVLVILTERHPGEAVKAVFVRCAYACIPLSLVLIRYYPDWGRAYSGYDRSALMYVGVTTHKNTLGALAFVAALFALWDLLDRRRKWRGKPQTATEKGTLLGLVMVLSMSWYLLMIADSATSLVCAVLGSVLLIALGSPSMRRSPGRVEACGLGLLVVLWVLDSALNVKEAFVQSLGREMTLTTRTDVWPILLAHQESPLMGAGFNTFWAGQRLVQLSESVGGIIQAHNGYLETYLNGGLVGVSLLAILLLSSYLRIRRSLTVELPEGSIRLVFLLLAMVHNFSEASFNKLSVLWLVTVFAMMEYRAGSRPGSAVREEAEWQSTASVGRP